MIAFSGESKPFVHSQNSRAGTVNEERFSVDESEHLVEIKLAAHLCARALPRIGVLMDASAQSKERKK